MPRLRNELTGAVMTVPEATVSRLGNEWVTADEAKPEPKRSSRTQKNDTSE